MRVGFYTHRPFHRKLFESTLAALSPGHKTLVTDNLDALVRFRPHVFVAAENLYHLRLRRRLPRTFFIHTRHGLASKTVPRESFAAADFVCVTSPAVRDDFLRRGIQPRRAYWPIGYVQMDNLLAARRPALLPAGRRVVLYAPTWNTGISSLPLLGDRVVDLLKAGRDDTVVVIKTHPLVQEDYHPPAEGPWLRTLRAACAGRSDVHLIVDPTADIMPWLNAADLLVSDASSVVLEFLALDRPVILIDHPDRTHSRFYDPDGYEWQWRDVARRLDNIEQLPSAIARALDHPEDNRETRLKRRGHLFGDTADGHCGRRLAAKIESLEPASELSLATAAVGSALLQRTLPLYRKFFHGRNQHTQSV